MPMTIKQIMAKAGPQRKAASAYVDITSTKVKKNKDGMPMVVCKTQSKTTLQKKGTDSKIKIKPKGAANTYVTTVEVYPSNKVIVSCSCDDFLYTWETALNLKGAARLEYSNGEMPNEKNPGNTPGCCIAENELVSTSRGFVPINDVKVGDKVQTLEGLKAVEQSVFKGKKRTVNVFTGDGAVLKLTPDHRCLTVRAGSVGWVEAKDLKNSDHLVKTVASASCVTTARPSLARVLGYMVAEGSTAYFSGENKDNLKDFAKHWSRAFPSLPYKIGKHGISIYAAGRDALADEGFVLGSYSKVVPEWILQGHREDMRNFIIGAYAGDGWVSSSNTTYGSVSLNLVRQLQNMLLVFGIFARITKNISGVNKSTMYLLRVSDHSQCQEFIKQFPPVRGVYQGEYRQSSGTALTDRIPFTINGLARKQAEKMYTAVYEGLNGEPTYIRHALTTLGIMSDGLFSGVLAKSRSLAFVPNPNYTRGRHVAFANNKEIVRVVKEPLLRKLLREHFPKAYGLGEWGLTKTKLRRYMEKQPALVENKEAGLACRKDVIFVKVKSVRPGKLLPVYDLAVEGTPHFTTSGFVVHNCKHVFAVGEMLIQKGKL